MKKTAHSADETKKQTHEEHAREHASHETTQAAEVVSEASSQETSSENPPSIDLHAEVEKYRDQALRAVADLENYRKRMIREKEEAIRYANAGLLEKLLPILDNFELGLNAAKATSDAAAMNILNGLSMVQRQLSDFLKDHGLHPVDAEGELFDPKLHEAIAHEPHESLAEGTVISQLRRGYRLADRLLRPASVVVSKGQGK